MWPFLVSGFFALIAVVFASKWLRADQKRQEIEKSGHAERLQFEQQLQVERERIYSDLHDDLGAKLLQLVYEAASPQQADIARTCLQDLRDVVSRTRGCPGLLSEILGEIEQEARQRLRGAKIDLDWQVKELSYDPTLNAAQGLQLFRIVREAISNVIKHAEAKALKVRVLGSLQAVRLDISDDGIGLNRGDAKQNGRGLESMRERAEKIAGDITWRAASIGGTRVLLQMPLDGPLG